MTRKLQTIAIIGNQAFSMLNFRGSLIKDLAARGHRVYALAPAIDEEVHSKLIAAGALPIQIDMARTGTSPFEDLQATISLTRQLRGIRPDIVLSYAAKPAIYGTLAAWLARVPNRYAMIEGLGYAFSETNTRTPKRLLLRIVVSLLFRTAFSRAKKVFFLNSEDIRDLSSRRIVNRRKAVNIGGIGVDLVEWAVVPPIIDPLVFIFVGRLIRDKGVGDFIAAARQVKLLRPDVMFVVLGGVDENPQSFTTDEARRWVEEGLVQWPGHSSAKEWLRKSSVLVLPSYYREGVPRSAQEAAAMGRPIITTDSVGCRDTVEDGVSGYLVPPRDPSAIATAMYRFIDNPELVVSMGVQSRILAERKFDVVKINSEIIRTMGL